MKLKLFEERILAISVLFTTLLQLSFWKYDGNETKSEEFASSTFRAETTPKSEVERKSCCLSKRCKRKLYFLLYFGRIV